MCCWYSFLLFFREEANYVIMKGFRPTFNFCSFYILLDMWSNLRLGSVTFGIKVHTIVSEVRMLFANKVLQHFKEKHNHCIILHQRVMPILPLLH